MDQPPLKAVVLDHTDAVIYQKYERHYSKISEKAAALLQEIAALPGIETPTLSISGSAGMGLAKGIGLPFVQEVYATRISAKRLCPETETVIELGGEDAKILFLKGGHGGADERLVRRRHRRVYRSDGHAARRHGRPSLTASLPEHAARPTAIASRCGVFAKTGHSGAAQPGGDARRILPAAILSGGRGPDGCRPRPGAADRGEGDLYLGGPLSFLARTARAASDHTLKLDCRACRFPENGAFASSRSARRSTPQVGRTRSTYAAVTAEDPKAPLCQVAAHRSLSPARLFPARMRSTHAFPRRGTCQGRRPAAGACLPRPGKACYLGIDAGSTTTQSRR